MKWKLILKYSLRFCQLMRSGWAETTGGEVTQTRESTSVELNLDKDHQEAERGFGFIQKGIDTHHERMSEINQCMHIQVDKYKLKIKKL